MFLSLGAVFAGSNIIEFISATSKGNAINVEWRASDEKNISRYEVERANDGESYTSIHTEYARGNNPTYTYEDKDVLNREGVNERKTSKTYSYKVKVIYQDNTYGYSNPAEIRFEISIISRTWGMIKEMFR